MPIFDQGYRHWHGQTSGLWQRPWAIARRGALIAFKNRWVRIALFLSIMPALLLATMLSLWGLVETQATWAETFLRIFGLPETVLTDKSKLRIFVWIICFHIFLLAEFFLAAVLVLLVGPDLISQDLRFNALPLYLSKPVRRFDYFLGKLGVVGLLVAIITLGPAILGYVMGVVFSLDITVIRDTTPVLIGAILSGLVFVVSAGMLMLAISSLSKNSRTVASIWLGLIMLSHMFAQIMMESTGNRRYEVISYAGNLLRVQRHLLGVSWAAQEFLVLQHEASEQARRLSQQMQGGPIGFLTNPKRPPPRPPEASPNVANTRSNRRMRRRDTFLNFVQRHVEEPVPAGWSYAVLGGLLIGSAGLLSFRVHSLDRLK